MCQAIDYGQILDLVVQNGEPRLDGAVVLTDIKLDSDPLPRAEIGLDDFGLRDEVNRLLSQIERLRDGVITRIDIRAGIPFRVVLQTKLGKDSG